MDIAAIAGMAFDAVGGSIDGVIQPATLTRTAQGAYDPVTGTYATTTQTWSGRGLFGDAQAMADKFPAYVIGPTDRMLYLEGLGTAPKESDTVMVGGQALIIMAVADIVGAGQFFSTVARNA